MAAEIHEITSAKKSKGLIPPIPVSVEIEQALLGCLLLNNEIIGMITSSVSVDDFSEEIHRRIFSVSCDLLSAGQSARPGTLIPYLGDQALSDDMTLSRYLARLCAESMPVSLASGYATSIRNLANKRRLIDEAALLDERARYGDVLDDPATIAAESILRIQGIAASSGTDTTRHVGDYSGEIMTLIEGVRSGEIEHKIVTTGYREIDEAANGYEPETLWVVAGRPGMGKSAYLNASAYRCARGGTGILEFPLEIGPQQAVARHLADICYRSNHSVAFRDIGMRAKSMSDDDLQAVREAHRRLKELPIEIDRRSRATVAQIGAKIAQTKRSMAARGITLGVVFIDHLDFIHASDRYSGNRTQEIGEILISLKDIARWQRLCIVLFSQLNRDVEKRPSGDRRPGLSDLRNSGDLEQAADVVMFLYREEYYLSRSPEFLRHDPEAVDKCAESVGKLEAIISKARAGMIGTSHLFCNLASSSISSVDRRFS
jgi:replicative DNA helicase